jgi:glycosyltransferase involved in cell wall biosynthesis
MQVNTGQYHPLTFSASPSQLVFEGSDRREPALSIAIPTRCRFDLLREAVTSALAQRCDRIVEIVVVDNDPDSRDAERLVETLPQLRTANFRYYVNATNIGMFGNWNRCIELGRGVWHTMLHDDDMLDPLFASTMLGLLGAHPEIDGIACRKHNLDQRSGHVAELDRTARPRRMLADLRRFGLSGHRRVTPRILFWANPIGNPVGFVCRKADAIAAGGYHEEDYPSGDHFFFARYAQRFHLAQSREALAYFRIAVNETLGEPVIRRLILSTWRLQQQYAGTAVPAWWARLTPLATACEIDGWNRFWKVNVQRSDIEDTIGQRLPRPNKPLYNFALTLLGGY